MQILQLLADSICLRRWPAADITFTLINRIIKLGHLWRGGGYLTPGGSSGIQAGSHARVGYWLFQVFAIPRLVVQIFALTSSVFSVPDFWGIIILKNRGASPRHLLPLPRSLSAWPVDFK